MRNLQVKTLFYWVAFLVLGFFSCYWTAESLYIWQPSLKLPGSWLVAILFYVMASLSFSLILKAFNRDVDFYGKFLSRGASLFVGVIGLILFWLVCSMPTNTHTLLYNAEVRGVIAADLQETRAYLDAYKHNNSKLNYIDAKYRTKQDQVDAAISKMTSEINDPSNPGIGPRFNILVEELDLILKADGMNNAAIQPVKNIGTNQKQWTETLKQYKSQAYTLLKDYKRKCDQEKAEVSKAMDSDVLNKNIDRCDKAIKDVERMNGVSNAIIAEAIMDLTDSYAFIKSHPDMITFRSKADSLRYCGPNPQPQVKALQVVPQVWKDYFTTDRYEGHGFIWWVLLSILVDLAGFIFFYLANKEGESY